MQMATQVTGNIGMYYAAYKLSQMGWNVMPTARNARGIDLIAYDSTGKEFKGIQVKALTKPAAVPLGSSTETVMGDWWIVLNRVKTASPHCFILKPEEVKRLTHQSVKNDKVSYWLERKDYETDEYCEKWDRIGQGDKDDAAMTDS
jgi:hypothetical protein